MRTIVVGTAQIVKEPLGRLARGPPSNGMIAFLNLAYEMPNPENRPYVIIRLKWLIESPPSAQLIATTAYREELGIDDLFSVVLRFSKRSTASGHWYEANLNALCDEMDARLPQPGSTLIITAGHKPVAAAKVMSGGSTLLSPPFQ